MELKTIQTGPHPAWAQSLGEGVTHLKRIFIHGRAQCNQGLKAPSVFFVYSRFQMFDMAGFNEARKMTQSCGSIYGMVVSGNMLLAGTYENTVNIWDLRYLMVNSFFPHPIRSHEYVRSLVGHSGAVYSVALSGNNLMSGSYDNTIRVLNPPCYHQFLTREQVWDLRAMKSLQRVATHSSSVEVFS